MAMRGAAPFMPVLPIIFIGVVFTLSHDSAFNKSELHGWMDWSRGRVTQGLIRRLAQSSGKKEMRGENRPRRQQRQSWEGIDGRESGGLGLECQD